LKHVPYSHRLKAGHLLRAWTYHPKLASAFEHGRNVYAILRVIRGVSPMNALVAELRDYVVDDLFVNLQAHVRAKIVRIWIEEVGRAAIELYSGRLRIDAEGLAAAAADEGLGEAAAYLALPGALRLLIAGRTNAGKTTLVNALLGGLRAGVDAVPTTVFEGYELQQNGVPAAYLIDSPGLDDDPGVDELTARGYHCDLILWVVPADGSDRELDRRALAALRARFAENPQRSMPPLVVVASHIDRLEPGQEWVPPIDLNVPDTPKEKAILAALDTIAADLDVPLDAVVPMRLDGAEPYNLDLLRSKLAESFGEAHRARWIRIQRQAPLKRNWRRTWKQIAGAGRIVGELVKR
jgi:predicted GTPase